LKAPALRADTAPESFELDVYLDGERGRVEASLRRALERVRALLPGSVAAAVEHGLLGGGKRLRPVLCVAAYRACGGDPADALYDLAASLELIHAYSLMHDDLPCMDAAELRRGLPTTHRVHGESVAVVAGAVMIPLAALQALAACRALGLEARQGRAAARELCRAAGAGGMVGGQVLDLLAEKDAVGPHALDALHGLKTGALLAASLRLGALAAGASPPALVAIDVYGRALGLAFQIADDVLDATATAEELGKNPSDAALGKSTYVSLHGLGGARGRARAEVQRARVALSDAGLGADNPRAVPLHAVAAYAAERSR